MNNDQLNQQIKRVLEKLTKIKKLFLCIGFFFWVIASRARHFMVGPFVSQHSRVHWLDTHRRARRLERSLLYLLFPLAMLLLEPREYATWAAVFGCFTAMTVPLISLRYLLRAYWVRG